MNDFAEAEHSLRMSLVLNNHGCGKMEKNENASKQMEKKAQGMV